MRNIKQNEFFLQKPSYYETKICENFTKNLYGTNKCENGLKKYLLFVF